MSTDQPDHKDRSVLIHGKFRSEKWDFDDHILPPITTSTAFRLRSSKRGAQGFQQFANPDLDRDTLHPIYIYARLDDPCQSLLEETLAFAEKGESAVCFATGMAAISAVLGIHVKSGDHILAHQTLYGCTYRFITHWLDRFNVKNTMMSFRDMDALRAAIRPETRVIYFESPCNPTLELVDIEALVSMVKSVNAERSADQRVVTVIDNTFATPYCQRPITMGIDYVVHSLTKNLGGFGADMGGAVIGTRAKETDLLLFRKDFGGSLSPKAAWQILVYGIPTLAVRVDRQQMTAQKVAEFLQGHDNVCRAIYPGLPDFAQQELAERQMRDIDGNFAPGTLIYFELAGSPEESYAKAQRVADFVADNALSVTLAVSLGQIRSLLQHPASMTHSAIPPEEQMKAGISPGGLRLSIGLEDPKDIIEDLRAALHQA